MKETQETWVQSLGREDPLEEGMATHPSILAWKISRTEEPGGLQSMGSQRIGHDWATNTLTLSLAMYNLIFPLVLNLESSLGSPQVFSEQASCPGSSVAFQITPGYLDACECPHFWREFSADFSPRHLWSISCLSCYLLFLVAVSSPLPYNNFKRCHQASAPGGLWVRWNKWNACVSPEVAARQIRTGKHSHLWRHSALLPPKPEPRAADQEYRLHVEPLCELARWWAGQGKMTQNFPCFQITFFLIQHSHGCCKTLFSGIMTVDSYSFCLFFFVVVVVVFPGGRESLELSTPPFLIKSLPLLLLSTPKYHRVSTECSAFCLLSHVHNYISSDWPNTLTNKNEHGGHCFKMTE